MDFLLTFWHMRCTQALHSTLRCQLSFARMRPTKVCRSRKRAVLSRSREPVEWRCPKSEGGALDAPLWKAGA